MLCCCCFGFHFDDVRELICSRADFLSSPKCDYNCYTFLLCTIVNGNEEGIGQQRMDNFARSKTLCCSKIWYFWRWMKFNLSIAEFGRFACISAMELRVKCVQFWIFRCFTGKFSINQAPRGFFNFARNCPWATKRILQKKEERWLYNFPWNFPHSQSHTQNDHKSKLSRRNSLAPRFTPCKESDHFSVKQRANLPSIYVPFPTYIHHTHPHNIISHDHQFFATWNFFLSIAAEPQPKSWCDVMNGVFKCLTLWPTPLHSVSRWLLELSLMTISPKRRSENKKKQKVTEIETRRHDCRP